MAQITVEVGWQVADVSLIPAHGVDTVMFLCQTGLLFTLAMKQEMMGMRSSLGKTGLM